MCYIPLAILFLRRGVGLALAHAARSQPSTNGWYHSSTTRLPQNHRRRPYNTTKGCPNATDAKATI